jgi:hypothetical protein
LFGWPLGIRPAQSGGRGDYARNGAGGEPNPAMIRESAEWLRSIKTRMGRMINDLLDLALSPQDGHQERRGLRCQCRRTHRPPSLARCALRICRAPSQDGWQGSAGLTERKIAQFIEGILDPCTSGKGLSTGLAIRSWISGKRGGTPELSAIVVPFKT